MDSPARPSQAKMASSTGGTEGSSPASSPASAVSLAAMAAPKYGTLVPNRIFVGGISASTSEAELAQLFSAYGNVKGTKIIADRGGVSKGYGFVTFETEEEAKRLQQESECIVLRERKLNIAPAIKKQPFNRSFDGGTGSPPAVPTSTYYYTNGMGLPYQNGLTFYNAGAPAPGAAIAPPTDPATLYQAAGVFGPQATASHQTFAPMMYPVPAPSLYMPQQYQYSPMPYEPYFPGTTAAGAPQFLYTSNGTQATTGNSGNGSGNTSTGTPGAGATSSPSTAPALGPSPHYQTHFYGSTSSHHHPGAMSGAPPPPPLQVEHLYYSYPPHAQPQPQPHHGGPLAGDQPLLIYSTDITGQSSVGESQVNQQEETRSTSSHSEQLQQPGTDSGQPPDPTLLVPLKYPLSTCYPNYRAGCHTSSTQPPSESSYPTPVYVSQFHPGNSLLPTPKLARGTALLQQPAKPIPAPRVPYKRVHQFTSYYLKPYGARQPIVYSAQPRKDASPPPNSSPMSRPNLSPTSNLNQVQMRYATVQKKPYPSTPTNRKTGIRQPVKSKMNGIVQPSEWKLGGAGDAPPIDRLPITPPTTPQQTSETSQQLNDTCHQIQTLTL